MCNCCTARLAKAAYKTIEASAPNMGDLQKTHNSPTRRHLALATPRFYGFVGLRLGLHLAAPDCISDASHYPGRIEPDLGQLLLPRGVADQAVRHAQAG